MRDEPKRPDSDEDREGWEAYWTAQGMAWRTEPEVDQERQRYLAERRAIRPDIRQGIYPFRDESGSIMLTRADIEWLLATHQSMGRSSPLTPEDERDSLREGIDLRGANVSGVDLRRLPLTGMRGGLSWAESLNATPDEAELAAARFEKTNFFIAHLEGARLTRARLEGAVIIAAFLEGANFRPAHLDGADLRRLL